jgi:hypothetical protein
MTMPHDKDRDAKIRAMQKLVDEGLASGTGIRTMTELAAFASTSDWSGAKPADYQPPLKPPPAD